MIPSKVEKFPDVGPDKVFADYIQKGEFRIQKCNDCQKHVFYPRMICTHCGSQNMDWVITSGTGVVYSTSVARGMPEGDYNISLIDLTEGPRMMSRVVDIAPEKVFIGMKVKAFIGEIDKTQLILFKPEENV